MNNKIIIAGLVSVFSFSFVSTSMAQQKRPVKQPIQVVMVKKTVERYDDTRKKVEYKPAIKAKVHPQHKLKHANRSKGVQPRERFRKPLRYKK